MRQLAHSLAAESELTIARSLRLFLGPGLLGTLGSFPHLPVSGSATDDVGYRGSPSKATKAPQPRLLDRAYATHDSHFQRCRTQSAFSATMMAAQYVISLSLAG